MVAYMPLAESISPPFPAGLDRRVRRIVWRRPEGGPADSAVW
jgi:hypothetical protein